MNWRKVINNLFELSLLFSLLILLSAVHIQSSGVFITKYYNISTQGTFLLVEQYKDSLIINEYPTFYTKDHIPFSMLLKLSDNISILIFFLF